MNHGEIVSFIWGVRAVEMEILGLLREMSGNSD